MFWATRGQLSPVAETLFSHRAGRVITIEGADAFFERLESLVSAQADAQRPNPRSVELLVASAKKFLARPEFRIQLDELIGGELRRIDHEIVAGASQPMDAWSNSLFISAVARYEAQTEILARIFGVLGRYGTGEEFRGALDAITRLGFREPASGFSSLTNLRTYPAVLLFYAYGIGLLKAQRFGDLFKLFSTPINTGRDQTQTVASHLLLTRWEGTESDPWKLLPEFDKRKTALSDYLHELFEGWTVDYLFTKGEYTTSLFEHFELLGTLAYVTLSIDKATLQAAIQSPNRDFVWSPIGRAAWDGRVCRPILESWKGDLQPLLLKAGFARGDQDYLPLAIESIGRLASRIGW
jgi:hypothetical protein